MRNVSSRARISLATALLCSGASLVLGGPHEGGTLILHHNASVVYTESDSAYCGLANLASCAEAVVRIDSDSAAVFHTLAAFVEGSAPRLAGITFGISYDDGIRIVAWKACGDFELANPDWPASGSGTAVTWFPVETRELVDVYWFAAYSASSEPQVFSLMPHPGQGGWFGDDSVPSQLDAIAGYGAMGFGTEGTVDCPVPPQPGACCYPDGHCELVTLNTCQSTGGEYLGDGTTCEPNPCPQPGACCYPDGHCEFVPPGLCSGEYQGDGTVCDPNPCPPPLGACCFPDGHCEQLARDNCLAGDGEYQGDFTLCDPNPCPAPIGACCFADSHCESLTHDECLGAGGEYLGDLVPCDPNPCPQYPGACCFGDGSCVVLVEHVCQTQGGSFLGADTVCDPNPCPQPGACCYPDGHCELVQSDSCGGEYQGDGTVCDPNPCAQPGACCYPDGHCELVQSDSCGGEYQGDGTSCDPNPCPQYPGACCFGDGSCVVLAEYLCQEQGGSFLGPDTTCDPNPCPQPGACCYPDGHCVFVLFDQCAGSGGEYQGDGVSCDPNPCPQHPGACCFYDGHCEVLPEYLCREAGGSYLGPDEPCDPNPCPTSPTGACCFGGSCQRLTREACQEGGGLYFGDDVPCTPNPCCDLLRAMSGGAHRHGGDGPAQASTGRGIGTVTTEEGRGGCGTLMFHADGTYENGYAWRYGGVVPPDYGAFAECYAGQSVLCSAVYDFTQVGIQASCVMDVLVYDDAGGIPGAVIYSVCVNPGPIAYWPSVSRHTFAIDTNCTSDVWWVGFWGYWPGLVNFWFVAADLDGSGGCPYTKIAPGVGFPTGWNHVSIVWGPTQAVGIGAEVISCATPTIDSSWGKIKHLFR